MLFSPTVRWTGQRCKCLGCSSAVDSCGHTPGEEWSVWSASGTFGRVCFTSGQCVVL